MFKTLFNLCILIGIVWLIGWMLFAVNVAGMDKNERNTRTQAIIVVTGGDGRIAESLALLSRNVAQQIFISGVDKGVSKDAIIRAANVEPTQDLKNKITLGYNSTDTISNAAEIRDWTNRHNIRSFNFVTSNYHITRAMLEIDHVLPKKRIIRHPVVSDDFVPWTGNFFSLTFSEYNKTAIRWFQTRF